VYLTQNSCFVFISKFVSKPYRPVKYLVNCILDPSGCALIIIVRVWQKLQYLEKFQQSYLIWNFVIILNDDRFLAARELEHVCLNVRIEGQGHTFANLVVNASKSLSQIASCVKSYEYKTCIIKMFTVFNALFKHANPQKQRFGAVGFYMNLLFTSVLGNMLKSWRVTNFKYISRQGPSRLCTMLHRQFSKQLWIGRTVTSSGSAHVEQEPACQAGKLCAVCTISCFETSNISLYRTNKPALLADESDFGTTGGSASTRKDNRLMQYLCISVFTSRRSGIWYHVVWQAVFRRNRLPISSVKAETRYRKHKPSHKICSVDGWCISFTGMPERTKGHRLKLGAGHRP